MIDWLIRQMFKIPALRINIFQEVDMYNSISRILADDESSKIACTIWCEEDGWRGWNIKEDGTYYFHDTAEHSLGDIMRLVTEKEDNYGMLTELLLARDHFKKLWSTILSNGVRQDSEGNWTVINSSTNKRRMDKTGSSVGGASGPSSQEWIPAKIYVTPEELAEIWDRQGGKCYWFGIDLDITLLYKDHKDWMPKHPLAPSIDKIDVSGDYTKDNIVICTRFANFGRNVCDFDRFHEIVKVLKGKEQTVGYGYDELKDFDMGYRGRKYKIITPFLGENR